MPSRSPRSHPDAHDLAAEIIRRATAAQGEDGGYVVRLSNPPTAQERLQPVAAHLQKRPIAIMPHKCTDIDEWVARYRAPKD